MTTVAYDGFSLCADTLIVEGSCKNGYRQKAFAYEGGALAFAGDCIPGLAVIAWMLDGGKKKDKPEIRDTDDFTLVWAKPSGQVVYTDRTLRWVPGCLPFTAGSGGDYALAAMKLGTTAKGAVELACEFDIYSGGQVTVIRVRG